MRFALIDPATGRPAEDLLVPDGVLANINPSTGLTWQSLLEDRLARQTSS